MGDSFLFADSCLLKFDLNLVSEVMVIWPRDKEMPSPPPEFLLLFDPLFSIEVSST